MEQEWDQERAHRMDGEEEKFEMERMKIEYDFQRERIRVNEGPTGSAHAYLVSYNKVKLLPHYKEGMMLICFCSLLKNCTELIIGERRHGQHSSAPVPWKSPGDLCQAG